MRSVCVRYTFDIRSVYVRYTFGIRTAITHHEDSVDADDEKERQKHHRYAEGVGDRRDDLNEQTVPVRAGTRATKSKVPK